MIKPVAAVAVTLLLAMLAGRGTRIAEATTTSAVPSAPPSHYADIEGSAVVIRATASGKVTDTHTFSGSIGALAAARDDRTFYLVDDSQLKATIKTFRVTGSGQIAGLAPVRGGTIDTHGGVVDSIAVSPDGSRLAVGEFFHPSPVGGGGPVADLIVINLRTGKQTVWQGIRKNKWPVSIPSVSWTPDGRSVVYVLQWCSKGLEGTDTCVGGGVQYAEIWSLDSRSHGGALV